MYCTCCLSFFRYVHIRNLFPVVYILLCVTVCTCVCVCALPVCTCVYVHCPILLSLSNYLLSHYLPSLPYAIFLTTPICPAHSSMIVRWCCPILLVPQSGMNFAPCPTNLHFFGSIVAFEVFSNYSNRNCMSNRRPKAYLLQSHWLIITLIIVVVIVM